MYIVSMSWTEDVMIHNAGIQGSMSHASSSLEQCPSPGRVRPSPPEVPIYM